MSLIPVPVLDGRNEERLAAEMITRTSGGLSSVLIKSKIAVWQELLKLAEAGELGEPACAELTNADPASPHTVILEAIGWHTGQFARAIDTFPIKNQIEFINLLGIELRVATPATTTLRFSVAPPPGQSVTIPAGTHVSTGDGAYIFTTDAQLVIADGIAASTVTATRTVVGHTLLKPDVLTRLVDVVAFVSDVTNASGIDSGTEAETVEAALERARRYLRRGERLVSSKDIEEAILDDTLFGNGVVRAFPFVVNGDFTTHAPGHTTVIVATRTGDAIGEAERLRIAVLLAQLVGNQWVYILNPVTVNFNIEADVRLSTAAPQGATLAAIESRLREVYSADKDNFGRPIAQSEIIGIIENTPGVDRIIYPLPGPILLSPLEDITLLEYQIPKLVNVTLHVV
jgi:hypothetical protein